MITLNSNVRVGHHEGKGNIFLDMKIPNLEVRKHSPSSEKR